MRRACREGDSLSTQDTRSSGTYSSSVSVASCEPRFTVARFERNCFEIAVITMALIGWMRGKMLRGKELIVHKADTGAAAAAACVLIAQPRCAREDQHLCAGRCRCRWEMGGKGRCVWAGGAEAEEDRAGSPVRARRWQRSIGTPPATRGTCCLSGSEGAVARQRASKGRSASKGVCHGRGCRGRGMRGGR